MDKINARDIADTLKHAKQTVVSMGKNENYYYCQSNFK